MSHRLECGMAVSGLRMAVVVQVGSPSPSLECGMPVSGLTMAGRLPLPLTRVWHGSQWAQNGSGSTGR